MIPLLIAVALYVGQAMASCDPSNQPDASGTHGTAGSVIKTSTALARGLSPEQALQAYEERTLRQLTAVAGYSDETIVEAELPATSQHGRFRLKRTFSAPGLLTYTALNFVGDAFIKNNVIVRLLQSDVDRVQKEKEGDNAIISCNYRFSYKGSEDLSGRALYVFAVKPHRKNSRLFRGKILIDSQTGHIVRAAGRTSKSPSWWIKRIDFVQDYADVGEFTMPSRAEFQSYARIIGPVIVTISHFAYEMCSTTAEQTWRFPPSSR